MAEANPFEDARGVDRAAIRDLLLLTPSERVTRLVETVETWSAILRQSGESAASE